MKEIYMDIKTVSYLNTFVYKYKQSNQSVVP